MADDFIRGEMLSAHTSFCVGGPASYFLRPEGRNFLEAARRVREKVRKEGLPLFILGGGANVLASDAGFCGIVLDTTGFSGVRLEKGKSYSKLAVRAGTSSDNLAEFAAGLSLSGLEFLAGLPGTAGGAVWMNARCYEKSISDVLDGVTFMDEHGAIFSEPFSPSGWDYKKSPFQNKNLIILEAFFRVNAGNSRDIQDKMERYRADRRAKGHFSHPSAGSVFKNNREFGKPSGQIIEELGLRGTQIGGARVADHHGNFIINTGGASAADIRALISLIEEKARSELGIKLEPEIIFLGQH
ncbi:MAG: UDP-N-acetylmuramate dehydrogenase [Spirochaetaceae bacterium]|jgi:UDP-N-acetylmuramate dehydrogenase|nr:UDP-N-acetylmuramate dehydrogenase [Spirochaetaceae bacterium]